MIGDTTLSSNLDICADKCMSKCCKSTPPALTEEDVKQILSKISSTHWMSFVDEEKRVPVVAKQADKKKCIFLTNENQCSIYNHRPLDCILFPLFVKIEQLSFTTYRLRWLVWYCPLTEEKGQEELYENARNLVLNYLQTAPDVIFDYQDKMQRSGGYKRKHFLKEEEITIMR